MRKLAAALMALMMIFAAVMAATAEGENALTFRNGVTFGMNMDQVIATEAGRYEIDREHDHGGIGFWELEYEHITENGMSADLKYYFVGNEMVAFRLNYEGWGISYDQIKADLTAKYGEAVPVDRSMLGNGVYAVDDDGYITGRAEAIVKDNLIVVIEQDEEDIDVTFLDMSAAYIK